MRALGWVVTGGSLLLVIRMLQPPWRSPVADLRRSTIRLVTQLAVPLLVGWIVGSFGGLVTVAAVAIGLVVGVFVGSSSRIAPLVFIAAVLITQVGALLNRFSVLELGLAVCWFSAALTAGKIITARRPMAATAALIALIAVVLAFGSAPASSAQQSDAGIACPAAVGETTPILDLDDKPQFSLSEYQSSSILSCPYAVNWDGQVVDPDVAMSAGTIRLAVEWFWDGERHICASETETVVVDVDDGEYLEYVTLSPTHQTKVYIDAKLGWAVSREAATAAADALLAQAEAIANPCVIPGEPPVSPIPLPGLIDEYYLAGGFFNETPNGGSNNVNAAYFSSYADNPIIYRFSADWWVSDGNRTPPLTLGCGAESTEGMNGDMYVVEWHSQNSYASVRLQVEELDYAPDEAVDVLGSVAEAAFAAASPCVVEEVVAPATTTTTQPPSSSTSGAPGQDTTTTSIVADDSDTGAATGDEAGADQDIDDTEAALAVLVGFMGLMVMAGEAAGAGDLGMDGPGAEQAESDDATDDQSGDGSNADGSDFMYTDTAEEVSGGLQSGLDRIDSLNSALDQLGVDGEDREGIDGYVNPIKENLGTVRDNVDLYQEAVEGAAEIVDDTERELEDYDIPRQVQDGIIFIRWMVEAGGEYLQDAVDTYMTPLTSRLADWFGGEASDYSRQAVPVDETSDELSDFVVNASQLVKGGKNYYGQEDGGEGIGPSVKDDLKWEFNE